MVATQTDHVGSLTASLGAEIAVVHIGEAGVRHGEEVAVVDVEVARVEVELEVGVVLGTNDGLWRAPGKRSSGT